MNVRDVGGAMGTVLGFTAIGLAVWITKSADPLWAILLMVYFVYEYPWSIPAGSDDKSEDEDDEEGQESAE